MNEPPAASDSRGRCVNVILGDEVFDGVDLSWSGLLTRIHEAGGTECCLPRDDPNAAAAAVALRFALEPDADLADCGVRRAADVATGADFLLLRDDLYLPRVVRYIQHLVDAKAVDDWGEPAVVRSAAAGRRLWDGCGAYAMLKLAADGVLLVNHGGQISIYYDARVTDDLIGLAADQLSKVSVPLTILNAYDNANITTTAPFGKTLLGLDANRDCVIDDTGLQHAKVLTILNARYNTKITKEKLRMTEKNPGSLCHT